MRPRLYLAYMLRESRGQRRRLAFFVACLAVGVAAVVAVAGLAASLDQAIRGEARQLLAADLAVRSWRQLPAELDEALARLPGSERADLREMVTVVAAPPRGDEPGTSRLVELKVVAGGYPFYGELELEPRRPLGELLDAGSTVVAPELAAALGLAVGDTLRVGGESFRITGVVRSEPDQLGGAFVLGPRVFLAAEGLARTALVSRGSRVLHRALVKLPPEVSPEDLRRLADELEEALGPTVRVETYAEAQPALRRGLERAERFLGLVALLSLLAGGIGVAQTVRAWLAGRMDAIAVLKCLGLRPREVLGIYLGQTALLGMAGSAVGVLVGLAVELAVPRVMGELVPAAAIDLWQPAAMGRGLALGIGVALLFSLPPLAAILRIPPARVLRRDAEPVPASRWAAAATGAVLALGVLALAAAQSGSLGMAAGFTGGLALVTGVLAASAWALTRLAARLRRPDGGEGADRSLRSPSPGPLPLRSLPVRHGLSALARPGAATLGAIVALGLGVLVVLGMSLVESQLSAQLKADLPGDAPTAFLINIQPGQWAGVEELLAAGGASGIGSAPVVTARLEAIDGESTEELARGSKGARRWALTREQQLTYGAELPAGSEVVAGELWSDPEAGEVSVEEEFARELGLSPGSRLTLDVQGVPLELAVTSLRSVDWESFGINFYLQVEPGVLEEAPQQRVAAARLPRGREQSIQDQLAARFPNVTLINVRQVLEKVAAVLERVGLGVRLLGGFTVLAGIAILAGAVSAGAARRGREVALLKTLGLTRLGVVAVFSVEYSLVGLAAGIIGAVAGGVLAWAVLTQGMEVEWRFQPLFFLVAVAGTAALAVLAGLAASARALAVRPMDALRSD